MSDNRVRLEITVDVTGFTDAALEAWYGLLGFRIANALAQASPAAHASDEAGSGTLSFTAMAEVALAEMRPDIEDLRQRAATAEASAATARALLARTAHDDRPTVFWDGRWTPIIWPDELATALAIGTGD